MAGWFLSIQCADFRGSTSGRLEQAQCSCLGDGILCVAEHADRLCLRLQFE